MADEAPLSASESAVKLSAVSPYIEQANERCTEVVKLRKELVLFTEPAKPLPQTAKNTVLRTSVFELYEREIERLYANFLA
jgi:hypothetical protein